ncbi:alpha-1,2-fucosyltransferase [Geobacter sp. AOG1]|uniref:alpha-1,2-fucosyltransferase n=1 Tax=Geobacter sp. AOG1 TaxID=1566346 RepID=UPI001CC68644|nr:alpha-1,2-fucosyltransferase [Geobacter sp. AOG1]GFE58471.1 hypothetical protein AOG1_23510 [Geobacter sp. AOG1]
MIILGQTYGQLGNRLAYLRTYLSFALEYKVKILNLAFDEYGKYFVCSNGRMITLPLVMSVVFRKILLFLVRFGICNKNSSWLSVMEPDNTGIIDLKDSNTIHACAHNNVLTYNGWPVTDFMILKKHDDQIKNFFTPVDTILNKVRLFLEQARCACDVLVGIHIRQGDYREWDDGRHFFHTHEYVSIMSRLLDMHKGRRVRFVISSNEEQDWDLFAGFDYRKAPGSAVEDLYILAGCDEIYGPQSSFSGWASYFGSVPLCWIRTPEDFDRAVKVME